MAAIDQAVANNLAALLRQEPRLMAQLARAYGSARREINASLRVLEAAAAAEIAAGRPINLAWLYRERATRDLLATVERTVGQFADGPAAAAVNGRIQTGARLGASHATAMVPVAGRVAVNPAAVERLIAATASGPVRDVLRSLAPQAVGAVTDALTGGIIAGRPLRRVSEDIARRIDAPLSRTNLIVRTETLRAYRTAQQDVYARHPDVAEWMWVAAKDTRCCAACWALHGTKHPTSEPLKAHPGCRCTAVPVVTGDPLDLGNGAVDLTVASPQTREAVLGPSMKRAVDAGVVQVPDLVGVRRSPVWGESVYVKSLREVLGPDGARRFYR